MLASCCAPELGAQFAACAGFSSRPLTIVDAPESANVLLVAGPLFPETALLLAEILLKMAAPRRVVAVGPCACRKGVFHDHPEVLPLDQLVPVDVFIPGCPPAPETVLEGLLALASPQ